MFSSMHVLALVVLYVPLLALCAPTISSRYDLPQALSTQLLSLVRANAISSSTESWELGTLAEALTEYEWPRLAVFDPNSIPPPVDEVQATDVFSIADRIVANKGRNQLVLIANDGASGDPASIGVSVLLRNMTQHNNESSPFATAATNQLHYLLHVAPRATNGAISHRANQVQVWADFLYMAPTFIAYYGALQGGTTGETLLQTAYEQVKLYRELLFDADVGLWRHIALGQGTDPSHWGTGNAWAAAGMLRVLATIARSKVPHSMVSQQNDLKKWVGETLDGVWKYQQANGALLNHIDEPNSFSDTSSTALLAASTFRFASITGDNTHIPAAIKALRLVRSNVDNQGWLLNTVDPLKFSTPSRPGKHSPEGQSFVLLLEAAVSEWQSSNS